MNRETWWTRFLHSLRYGFKIMSSFWKSVDKETQKEADFGEREKLQGFEKFNPHTWLADQFTLK